MCCNKLCWYRILLLCSTLYQRYVRRKVAFTSWILSKLFAVRRVPPHFTIRPEAKYEVKNGASLNITCVAVGSPMPFVKWREGSRDLTPDNELPIGKNVLELENICDTSNYYGHLNTKHFHLFLTKTTNYTVKVWPAPWSLSCEHVKLLHMGKFPR